MIASNDIVVLAWCGMVITAWLEGPLEAGIMGPSSKATYLQCGCRARTLVQVQERYLSEQLNISRGKSITMALHFLEDPNLRHALSEAE
jgi:hypothetical protein